MDNKILNQKAFTLAGFMILLAVLAIAAIVVLRIIFSAEITEWENSFLQSYDLAPETVHLIIGISGILIITLVARRKSRKRKYRKRKKTA